MRPGALPSILVLSSALSCCHALSAHAHASRRQPRSSGAVANRRDALSSIFAVGATAFSPIISSANAAEDNQVLSDEEMAARIARKMELLRSAKSGAGSSTVRATDVRSDVNPEAAASLRSRSAVENAKMAMEKQRELKNRDKAQKREDLCEMLGRGC